MNRIENKRKVRSMTKEKIGFGSNVILIALPPCDLPASVEWTINLASTHWPFNISRHFTSQEGIGKNEDIDILQAKIKETLENTGGENK